MSDWASSPWKTEPRFFTCREEGVGLGGEICGIGECGLIKLSSDIVLIPRLRLNLMDWLEFNGREGLKWFRRSLLDSRSIRTFRISTEVLPRSCARQSEIIIYCAYNP